MNILTYIRRNWLFCFLSLLLFTIVLSHKVAIGIPPLAWWHVCWFPVALLVAGLAGGNNWLVFRPLRWLTWLNMKDHFIKRFTALKDNPMVYPALLWLELGEAEQAYIRGGMPGFQKAFNAQCDRLKKGFSDLAETLAGPKTAKADCCGGDCGCHTDKAI